jgi:hypothetical protein
MMVGPDAARVNIKGTCCGEHKSVKTRKLWDRTIPNIAFPMHPTNAFLNPIELMLLCPLLKAASDGFKYNRYWGEV